MLHFCSFFLYIALIAFLPLIYATVRTISAEKLGNATFLKLLIKDFLRTFPICALAFLPITLFPSFAKPYIVTIHFIFMPLMFLEIGHIYLFGTRIGLNTFYSFFVSNIRETREFIGQNIPLSLYIGAFCFLLIPLLFLLQLDTPIYTSDSAHIIASTLCAIIAFPFLRNLTKKWPKFKDGYVLNPFSNLLYHYLSYRHHYHDLQQKIAQHHAPAFSDLRSLLPDQEQQTYIIVIGESANAHHCSWYGYSRNTNEFTSGLSSLCLFDGVHSQYAQTMPSLEKAISFANEAHPDFMYTKGSLIDYFKQAGFKTYWLSNQYALEDTVITAMTTHADYNKCFNYSGMKRFEKAGLDEDMLPDIQRILAEDSPKKVIFVHLIGSHSAYINRYPASFRHFKDALPNKQLSESNQELLNTYDDSIRYTDWVLSRMISLLDHQKEASYLLYFSDHGEDIFDSTTTKILGHSELANEPMTAIPLILWVSPTLNKLRPDICKRSSTYQPDYKLEDLIHTIIDISSLTNPDYQSDKSILNR